MITKHDECVGAMWRREGRGKRFLIYELRGGGKTQMPFWKGKTYLGKGPRGGGGGVIIQKKCRHILNGPFYLLSSLQMVHATPVEV